MNTKLEVRDLQISFRTVSGKVQAVRGINFELHEGETLAIVGESGSGKSVTSKAILGIQAGNAITEGGEILYDGMDLLKISEDDFYKIRGDKIAMIFQDPLSSLNPIMRIGNQLTEAMLLKGKARQRNSKAEFDRYLTLLNKTMVEACGSDSKETETVNTMCRSFRKFEMRHAELERAFSSARNACEDLIPALTDALFLIEKNGFKDARGDLDEILELAEQVGHRYVVTGADLEKMQALTAEVKKSAGKAIRKKDYASLVSPLTEMKAICKKAAELPVPDFFAMGYYETFSGKSVPEKTVPELNAELNAYLSANFLNEFMAYTQKALSYSADKYAARQKQTIEALKAAAPVYTDEKSDCAVFEKTANELSKEVNASIDQLEIIKNSDAYTFESALHAQIQTYRRGVRKNPAEERRFAKQQAKYQAFINKNGYEPEWKPSPLAVVDFELVRGNMEKIIIRLQNNYETRLEAHDARDYAAEAEAVVEYLKDNAAGIGNKVTRSMAKARALKLMEEVGIPEPRQRYHQYPFEFSGGMRQRIVIAIALAANPDILICDEPTTALDVTIQAQILELINKLKAERNLSIIFITHDLGVVANMADKIAVMYAGKIVEYGTSEEIFYSPAHPYTWALLSSMPDLDTNDKLESIPGTPPDMIYPPKGDAFAERNKFALKIDFEQEPPMFDITETHRAATWLLHPDAPRLEPPKIVTDRIKKMQERRGQ